MSPKYMVGRVSCTDPARGAVVPDRMYYGKDLIPMGIGPGTSLQNEGKYVLNLVTSI